jgi:hypothetical protein
MKKIYAGINFKYTAVPLLKVFLTINGRLIRPTNKRKHALASLKSILFKKSFTVTFNNVKLLTISKDLTETKQKRFFSF